MNEFRCTVVSQVVDAPREAVYQALLDPQALVEWLPPQDMRGEVHSFDARPGGEFRMSLIYLDETDPPRGAKPPTEPTPSRGALSSWSPANGSYGRCNSNRPTRRSPAK